MSVFEWFSLWWQKVLCGLSTGASSCSSLGQRKQNLFWWMIIAWRVTWKREWPRCCRRNEFCCYSFLQIRWVGLIKTLLTWCSLGSIWWVMPHLQACLTWRCVQQRSQLKSSLRIASSWNLLCSVRSSLVLWMLTIVNCGRRPAKRRMDIFLRAPSRCRKLTTCFLVAGRPWGGLVWDSRLARWLNFAQSMITVSARLIRLLGIVTKLTYELWTNWYGFFVPGPFGFWEMSHVSSNFQKKRNRVEWSFPPFLEELRCWPPCVDDWSACCLQAVRDFPFSSRSLSVVVLKRPDSEEIGCFVGKALPFGSTASVVYFNRLSRLVWRLGLELFIPWCNYFDDFPVFSPRCMAPSTMSTALTLLDLLGFSYAPEKLVPFDTHATMLGVEISCSEWREGACYH